MVTNPNAREEFAESATITSLLEWDGTINVREKMEFEALEGGRPAFVATIGAISQRTMAEIRERAVKVTKNRQTGQTTQEMDWPLYNDLVVCNGILDPYLKHPQLQEAFNSTPAIPSAIVNDMFLPGEQQRLFDRIMRLSGFDPNEEEEITKTTDADLS